MKAQWLKSHHKYGYFPGDVCDLSKKEFKELAKTKHVIEYVAPEPEAPAIDLPEDFPGRDALIENNVFTLAEVKEIEDFTEIKGIGKSLNAQIHEYLKNS